MAKTSDSQVHDHLDKKTAESKTTEYIYGEFNAWSYEHTDNIQAGVTQEVINALTKFKPKRWYDLRVYLYKVCLVICFSLSLHWKRIIFLIVPMLASLSYAIYAAVDTSKDGNFISLITQSPNVAGVAGIGSLSFLWLLFKEIKKISAQPLARELKTYLRLPSYGKHLGTIPVMRNQIRSLCRIRLGKKFKKHRRLLFVIDDLDRCGINAIVKTFEAVRLILDLENVVVVIAVDQRIALPALACNYEKLSNHHQNDAKSIARDYLAKVINLPIYLPVPGNDSVAKYLADLWRDEDFVEIAKAISVTAIPVHSPDNEHVIKSENDAKKDEKLPVDEEVGDAGTKEETLDDILQDIESIDIASFLVEGGLKPKGDDVTAELGLSPDQKKAFYYWLLAFNLRNPRQVKRLYNSYNILQACYGNDEEIDGIEHGFPFMVSLFALEMINQSIQLVNGDNSRQRAKAYLFGGGSEEPLTIPKIESAFVELAEQIITKSDNASLQQQVEPFVLPSVEIELGEGNKQDSPETATTISKCFYPVDLNE